MTAPTTENQENNTTNNNKEFNFRALEAKYEKQLAQERSARLEAEKVAQEALQRKQVEDDEDDEPYVAPKKLDKKLEKFGQQSRQQNQQDIQQAVQLAIQEERRQGWIKSNPDFYEVLQHADKLAQKDPDLAESILEMPEGFERQKLAYKAIKSLGVNKPETKSPSIQEKIDANRRSPYYQPTGIGTAPYASAGDFSTGGQEQAYRKMQELKKNLRLG